MRIPGKASGRSDRVGVHRCAVLAFLAQAAVFSFRSVIRRQLLRLSRLPGSGPMNHSLCSTVICLLVVAAAAVHGEEGAPPDLLPTLGSIERLDPRFDPLVPRDAVI